MNGSTSEITKVNILNHLSKILELQSENKVEITNNVPAEPVKIIFTDKDDED
jgi:hypothetical protein